MLPFTPITEELLRRHWVEEEYPVVSKALSGKIEDGWKGFLYMEHAIIDKEAAWQEAQTLTGFDDGNSRTNTLYWIATRP
jgi:endo-1,3(4)-beta-glucanase